MKSYRWKKRPLLVFSPSTDYSAFKRQLKLLGGRGTRMRERDMVVVLVAGDRVSTQYGQEPGENAGELRRAFSVSGDEFAVLLVGKDTDVKRRSDAPVTAESIFAQIDTMPMRKQEIERKQQAS